MHEYIPYLKTVLQTIVKFPFCLSHKPLSSVLPHLPRGYHLNLVYIVQISLYTVSIYHSIVCSWYHAVSIPRGLCLYSVVYLGDFFILVPIYLYHSFKLHIIYNINKYSFSTVGVYLFPFLKWPCFSERSSTCLHVYLCKCSLRINTEVCQFLVLMHIEKLFFWNIFHHMILQNLRLIKTLIFYLKSKGLLSSRCKAPS